MTKTIFFDLDGTLTDSGPGIMNCAKLALDHFGIPVENQAQLRAFVGPPLRISFAVCYTNLTLPPNVRG